jgi:hypothetical protein
MTGTETHCRNCGAAITTEYCGHCGQREGRRDLHFAEAAGEMAGDIFRWDSRLWLTLLPLMVRPGFLTAEFIAGRRARYVPPFRLYIILSFILFMVVSLEAGRDAAIDLGRDTEVSSQEAPAAEPTETQVLVGEAIKAANEESEFDIALGDEDSPDWVKELEQRIESRGGQLERNPGEFMRQWLDALPQMMFVLLPVFALMLRLVYLRSPFHYLQHLVFSLHYHSFTYLLYVLVTMLEFLGVNPEGWHLLFQVVYLPLALRRAYDSSWVGAVGKSFLLMFWYGVTLIFGFAAITLIVLLV